jgi:hypothetical protein
MIKKEHYTTRKDGVKLCRTYSDTDHLIKRVADGVIYDEAIDTSENEEYEEVEEYVDFEGADTYDEIRNVTDKVSAITRKINRISLTDNEALSVMNLYPRWKEKINSTIEVGFITLHEGNLWRARQTHTALEAYPPSLNTASLYEIIVEEHAGTVDDPIPYTAPMEIFAGKYYSEDATVYRCTRDSGTALSHSLKDLINIYVEVV